MKVKDGGDPIVYMLMKQEVEQSHECIAGHLMMDEIKLKNGISFNCKSKEVIGFLPDNLNTKHMLGEILNGTKKKKVVKFCQYMQINGDSVPQRVLSIM